MRSALLSRSLTRPLSAGKGRSRRVDRVLACSASGPLLTPHTRRQGYFRPRSPDASHLGASFPFQRRSTLAFAEDSCHCPRYSASCRQVHHVDAKLVCNPVRRHRILVELGEACNSACAAHPTPSCRGRPRPWALCRPWLHRACILCMHPGTPCFVVCQTPF